jgi:Holliday junction resolvase RusA-like endonuclease
MKLAFVVEGPPQPKERARMGAGGRWFTPKRTREYETRVANAALVAMQLLKRSGHVWPRDAAYRVELLVCFPDARKRDGDNVLKAVLDGLNPRGKSRMDGVWRDDSQVDTSTVVRRVDRTRPRVEVVVETIP